MSDAERVEEVRRDHATRSGWARKGWKTRRANAGQGPGPVEASKPVQVFLRDLELARSFAPDAKPAQAFRVLVDGLRMAMESGALRWTGEKWELAAGRPQDAQTPPPPPSALSALLRSFWGILDAVRGLLHSR